MPSAPVGTGGKSLKQPEPIFHSLDLFALVFKNVYLSTTLHIFRLQYCPRRCKAWNAQPFPSAIAFEIILVVTDFSVDKLDIKFPEIRVATKIFLTCDLSLKMPATTILLSLFFRYRFQSPAPDTLLDRNPTSSRRTNGLFRTTHPWGLVVQRLFN